METIVFDQTPLADYLTGAFQLPPPPERRATPPPPQSRDARNREVKHTDPAPRAPAEEGQDEHDTQEWVPPQEPPPPARSVTPPSPTPHGPLSFAPQGRPMVPARFRARVPSPLRLDIPAQGGGHGSGFKLGRASTFSAIRDRATHTLASTMVDRSDAAKFLEQFRYSVVASQLLSGHTILAQQNGYPALLPSLDGPADLAGGEHGPESLLTSSAGAVAVVVGALATAFALRWLSGRGYATITWRRAGLFGVLVLLVAILSQAYIRRQWLRYLHEKAVAEVTAFVSSSQDLDGASGAAITLIQEVELVSRGYRISAPLPPISRLEDRSQTKRCIRLRKALKASFAQIIAKYQQTTPVIQGFSEQLDLEKYYDIYDISDLDISDAQQGVVEEEFEDPESLRALKVLAARLHTIRKIFLCALLALDAKGDESDHLHWTTVVEGLHGLMAVTRVCYDRLRNILAEEQSFPNPATPKVPLTPGRERWRSQLRKLNSLSSGIRGLQAKMHLLREESDKALNESDDISELGGNLMAQYESIGQDLQTLMHAWEEGKSALASGIDRNEKRLSTMSNILSPTTSLSGLTTVEDGAGGGVLEALKTLTGESPSSTDFHPDEPETEEIFEAVAIPRARSTLTREERIIKMREDRERKELAKEKADATRGMLRELEMVINLRPKGRTNPAAGRIVSL